MGRECWETALDGGQQVFVPLDLEVGMQPALHQDAGAAEVERLLDLREDYFVGMKVPFGVAHGPVERAEAAILGAQIRVVDIAVHYVAYDAVRMQLPPHSVAG